MPRLLFWPKVNSRSAMTSSQMIWRRAARRPAATATVAREGLAPWRARTMASFERKVSRWAVLDWEGVGDEAGKALPVSPEGIDALLNIWPIFEAFQTLYVAKGLILDGEKNASAPLPNGPSAGAKAIAPPVQGAAPTVRQD